ncbi:ATP-binding protein [Agromyces bracchium]|uniref:Uncharacterized protein n=1 Tax=Agromyces bracchium TaxID=88376 RepID=A0A6I3MA26_9MICO|nr:ATP-binding protein [Agromyces bracchium]MTH69831.1 hypothetical protein [Agromyces bracchium]
MSDVGGSLSLGEEAEKALSALLKAWSERPPAESSAFAESLAPTAKIPQSSPNRSAEVEHVRLLGAASGAVRPADLVAHVPDQRDQERLLSEVAADFDHTIVNERMTWTLRGPQRSAALEKVRDHPDQLAGALAQAAGITTDPPGDFLRDVLARVAGDPTSIDAATTPHVDTPAADVAQALMWAAGVGDFSQTLARVNGRAHVESIIRSYAGLLDHGLVGRERQRADLARFVDEPRPINGPVAVMTVTGIGGSGKSTLLADVILPRLHAVLDGRRPGATVVVDLDRVAFRPHAEIELSYEVTRQLGAAWPELAGPLATARAEGTQERVHLQEFASGVGTDVEYSSRGHYTFQSRVQDVLYESPRASEPVVVVLDTFEEWQRSRPYLGLRGGWNDPERVMAEWLDHVQYQMGLRDLRIVIAGRAKFETVPSEEVELPDLDDRDAALLLTSLGVEDASERLAKVVGGNPLSLQVAARFFRRLPAGDREAFLEGESIDEALDVELRRAVLYDRFLKHIEDPDVRRLAHPGLVLRRINSQLVRDVLAEPCGFKAMSAQESEMLVDKLADEVWLVRESDDGSLRHLPEVRRGMLALMSSDPKLRGTARRIHEAAAKWYNPRPEISEPLTAQNIEAFYHRMMVSQDVLDGWGPDGPDQVVRKHHAAFARELGDSVSEMPPEVDAQLRTLRDEVLPPDKAELLPKSFWAKQVELAGPALIEQDDPDAAIELFHAKSEAIDVVPDWLALAYCDAAQWDDYAAFARTRHLPQNRYDAVNRIIATDPTARDSLLTRGSPVADAFTQFVSLLARAQTDAFGPVVGHRRPRPDEMTSPTPFPVDQLRRAVVLLSEEDGRPMPLQLTDRAGLLSPNPQVMRGLAALTDDDDLERMAEQLERLAQTPEGIRSADILGRMAAEIGGSPRFRAARVNRLGPMELAALRGDNPELRPAIRNVLASVAPDDEWLKTLGAIAQPLLAIRVVDLQPAALPLLSEPTARSSVVTLVEFVDRSRVTRRFLHAVAERLSHPRLEGLVHGFDRWDDAHDRLLAAVTR